MAHTTCPVCDGMGREVYTCDPQGPERCPWAARESGAHLSTRTCATCAGTGTA